MKRHIEAFTDGVFDLCIIGGGITGAGAALDAASRGWRVALIDKSDFASGTSSASSKLIHGGIRYLEYGHLGLVYEALHERGRLLANAPHLVQPLPFVLPVYAGQRMPAWKWRLGLTLYDILAGQENIARSRRVSVRQLRSLSGLRLSGLTGGALYHDALMDDARVCITVLKTASRLGAVLANYVQAVGFEKAGGKIVGVSAHDRIGCATFTIRCRAVLNAAGPWADSVCGLSGSGSEPQLQPTKGVHLIAPVLGHRFAFLLLHPRDGRVFFVIPWLGRTLIGTTDTVAVEGPDDLRVLPDEIEYLLEGYNHFFDHELRAANVMGAFAGLRPLIRATPGKPSARSREFRLERAASGLWTALGGKYTTYRAMAESIVDAIGANLGRREPCRTRTLRLVGAPDSPWPRYSSEMAASLQARYPIAADSAMHLLHRYGTETETVLESIQAKNGFERVHPDEPDLIVEQAYQRNEEMAMTAADLFLRRSRIGMYRPEVLKG